MSSARDRARGTRRALLLVLGLRALAWGAAVMLASLAVSAALDVLVGLPLGVRQVVRVALPVIALGVTAIVAWRGRAATSLERVALWVEERVPSLRYAFVTATDPRYEARVPVLESAVNEATWGAALARRSVRALAMPVVTGLGALVLLAALPAGTVARVRAPTIGDALDRARASDAEGTFGLSPIVATVTPPAYTREPARTLEEPRTIAAPVGSRVVLRGRFTGAEDRGARRGTSNDSLSGAALPPVAARVGDESRAVTVAADRWTLSLEMPARASAIRLSRGQATRLIALEPRPDSAPVVVLSAPQRDSVYATPAGRLELAAEAHDDYGVASIAFEYIVTSGSGERFTFRQGTIGSRSGEGERRVTISARLVLESLELGPGDVVHLRAVASDANAVSGAATGASETRAIRIARIGERDSLAIEGAPPPEPDRAALSQRMLILLTEALEERRPRLDRSAVVSESRTLARDQARLRQLVGEIIFTRLGDEAGGEHSHGPGDGHDHSEEELRSLFAPESLLAAADRATGTRAEGEALDFAHGESPVLAINRPLLAAYNHMWDAGRELEQGEPGRALPPMRRALDALQEARSAERYFMRGRPPTIVVDIDRVRLARREDVEPADRSPGDPADRAPERHAGRYARAVELLRRDPAAAVDSLLLLRIDALDSDPPLARALGDALEALRTGRDATLPLLRARRTIEGPAGGAAPLGRWGGGW